MELVVTKVHLRNLIKSEKTLKNLTDNTPVKFAYVKYNHRKNTGYISIFGEKRFVDYVIKILNDKGFLTGDTSHCGTKYYI